MSETQPHKPSIWFWVIAGLFIVWNLIGVSNYLMAAMATPDSLAKQGYTAEQTEFMLTMPKLYLSVFALAVWSGLLAAILFLLRRSWAVPVYLFSLIFVVISFILDFTGGTFTVLGNAYLGIMLFVTVMAIIEYLVARRFRAKGILR